MRRLARQHAREAREEVVEALATGQRCTDTRGTPRPRWPIPGPRVVGGAHRIVRAKPAEVPRFASPPVAVHRDAREALLSGVTPESGRPDSSSAVSFCVAPGWEPCVGARRSPPRRARAGVLRWTDLAGIHDHPASRRRSRGDQLTRAWAEHQHMEFVVAHLGQAHVNRANAGSGRPDSTTVDPAQPPFTHQPVARCPDRERLG